MKVVRFLLFPFAILYDVVTRVRNYFFDVGIFKQHQFKIPVIVVGNLSVGGTGKTPQIEYLIRLLKDEYELAVLSRGYKRKTTNFLLVDKNHKAIDVGDEPLQYFKKFNKITVAVDANRVNGIHQLQKNNNPEIILLDDAYQHRKVKASFSILLTKYNDLFVDDYLLPTGNLRESRKGASRSDLILVTKCPENLSTDQQNIIIQKLEKYNRPVFFTTIKYASQLKGFKEIILKDLKHYTVLLITGIANPKPMLQYLNKNQVNFQHLQFNDHHDFSEKEIVNIKHQFDKIEAEQKIILTTEKDFMRLENRLEQLSYLPIETSFINKKKIFDKNVFSFLASFK
jgi:tetraacyldisaccharide 4'-kinase